MSALFLPIIALIVMAALSLYAAGRLKMRTVPMQWNFRGRPTWFAPRLVGLWFVFALAAPIVGLSIVLAEPHESARATWIAGLFLVIHIFYLALLFRWARGANSREPR